jgi:hypothetical protein
VPGKDPNDSPVIGREVVECGGRHTYTLRV